MADLALMAALVSTPSLGIAEGLCRPHERGPAIIATIDGLKDRSGRVRLELYPANDRDFLADDNVLVEAGKTFARADIETPASGIVQLCIRVPQPGRYALSFLHDRNANHRFDAKVDGLGFAGNPPIGWAKPRAAQASVDAGPGLTYLTIVPAYLHGLRMRPEAR